MKTLIRLIVLVVILELNSCTVYNTLIHGVLPSQHDATKFSQREIKINKEPFYFSKSIDSKIGSSIGLTNKDLNSTNVNLDKFVKLHHTLSFLIIKNDTIIYEYYKNPEIENSTVSSFSLVKPIVSTLIGIAIDEGKIESVEDPITKYLPEYRDVEGWDKIKIRHLLHHTSGLKFSDGKFNLGSDNAKYYWGKTLRNNLIHASIEMKPDTKFHYSSLNTQLLGRILEEVTHGSISSYLQEKIWIPLEMEAPAYWSLDNSKDEAMEKVFCCLQARTIDFAKIGRLYLNNGNWNGDQIISKKWVDYSLRPDLKGNNKHYYNNNWGLGPANYGSFYAVGLYGQYLYMYPKKKLIIVRFGDTDISYHPNYWNEVFLQLIDQL